MYQIRLYVAGQSPKTIKTIEDLKRLFTDELDNLYSLEIINVLENPLAAKDDRVLATPTIVKLSPQPVRRIVGDFRDGDRVLESLGMVNQ